MKSESIAIGVAKAFAFMILASSVALLLSGCAASLDKLKIDDGTKISIAIESGCAAAATAGCFEDADVQAVFGDFKTSEKCVSVLSSLVYKSVVADPVDVVRLTSSVFTCKKFKDAISYLKGTVPKGKVKQVLSDFNI